MTDKEPITAEQARSHHYDSVKELAFKRAELKDQLYYLACHSSRINGIELEELIAQAITQHTTALQSQLDTTRQELQEILDTYRIAIEDKCAPDERHCPCVPALRWEADRLGGLAEEWAGMRRAQVVRAEKAEAQLEQSEARLALVVEALEVARAEIANQDDFLGIWFPKEPRLNDLLYTISTAIDAGCRQISERDQRLIQQGREQGVRESIEVAQYELDSFGDVVEGLKERLQSLQNQGGV